MTKTMADDSSKIQPTHRERDAYIYIRQSSLRQVEHHTAGRQRQYDLLDWTLAMGWSRERIVLIDEDQGKSGAVPNLREGFGRLIGAVARGEVGMVVALEASRLARNSPDWHHLVYLCRWTQTLICDEHTIYDPQLSADRMVLGIRGQVSELELDHSIQRMVEARWSKARRGELLFSPPPGYEIDDLGQWIITSDETVSNAIRMVFSKFNELGSARQVFVWWHEQGLKFPVRRVHYARTPWCG
jgi:DNA invertase Pin-like site-specific DNA recombinase